jgi:hypothetical protein
MSVDWRKLREESQKKDEKKSNDAVVETVVNAPVPKPAVPWTCSLCNKTFPDGPRSHTCKQPETVKMPLKSLVGLIELRATLERLRTWKRFDPFSPDNILHNRTEPAILAKACKDLDEIIGDKK